MYASYVNVPVTAKHLQFCFSSVQLLQMHWPGLATKLSVARCCKSRKEEHQIPLKDTIVSISEVIQEVSSIYLQISKLTAAVIFILHVCACWIRVCVYAVAKHLIKLHAWIDLKERFSHLEVNCPGWPFVYSNFILSYELFCLRSAHQ